MKTFYVTVAITDTYEIAVDADDEDTAQAQALEIICKSENPDEEFGASNEGFEVIHVEEAI